MDVAWAASTMLGDGYPLSTMSRRTIIALIAGAVAAAVVVVAVALAVNRENAPPTRAGYQTAVVSARNRTDAALGRITKSQSQDELIGRLDDAAVVIDREAVNLDDTGAVVGSEKTNKRLVAALHELSHDLKNTAEQFRQPDFTDLLNGTRGLSFESWTHVNTQLAALRARGIAVKPLARH